MSGSARALATRKSLLVVEEINPVLRKLHRQLSALLVFKVRFFLSLPPFWDGFSFARPISQRNGLQYPRNRNVTPRSWRPRLEPAIDRQSFSTSCPGCRAPSEHPSSMNQDRGPFDIRLLHSSL